MTWRVEARDNGKNVLVCEWSEQDGPPCHEPEKRGHGTYLIDGTAKHMGGAADLRFLPTGLVAIISIPL